MGCLIEKSGCCKGRNVYVTKQLQGEVIKGAMWHLSNTTTTASLPHSFPPSQSLLSQPDGNYYYANSHTRCICRPSTHNHTHIKHHVSRTEATESIFTRQESACSPLNKAGQVGSGEDLSANLEFYGVAFRGCLRRNQ